MHCGLRPITITVAAGHNKYSTIIIETVYTVGLLAISALFRLRYNFDFFYSATSRIY